MIHASNQIRHGLIKINRKSVKNYHPTYLLTRMYEPNFNGLRSTRSYLIKVL